MLRLVLVSCLLLVASAATSARGDDAAARSIDDTVLAVQKAHAEGHAADLRALAARDTPDPWRVAEVLLVRGLGAEALAFARAAKSAPLDGLPAYVKTRRKAKPDAESLEAHARAQTMLETKGATAALAFLKPVATDLTSVTGIGVEIVRGSALRAAHRLDEALATLRATAKGAKEMGWLAGADRALQIVGRIEFKRGHVEGGREAWLKRLVIAAKIGPPGRACVLHGDLALYAERVGKFGEAMDYRKKTYAWHLETGDKAKQAFALVRMGVLYVRTERYDEAFDHATRALALAEAVGDLRVQGMARGVIGAGASSLGDIPRALQSYTEALKLARRVQDPRGVAVMLGNVGNAHMLHGDFARALEFQEQALAAAVKLRDLPGQVRTHGNMGMIFFRLHDLPGARASLERSLAISGGRDPGDWNVRLTLGLVFAALKQPDRAEAELRKALATCEARGRALEVSVIRTNLGMLLLDAGRSEEAEVEITKALATAERLGDRRGIALNRANLGLVRARLGAYDKALALQRQAVEEAEGDRTTLLINRWGLAETLHLKGEYAEALTVARAAAESIDVFSRGHADEHAARLRDAHAGVFLIGCGAALEVGDNEALAWFLERGRARALLESLGGRAELAEVSLPAELLALERDAQRRLTIARRALGKAARRRRRGEKRKATAQVHDAEEALDQVVRRIQRTAKARASILYPEQADVAQLRSVLRADEALVLYGLGREGKATGGHAGTSVVALLVTPKRVRALRLGGMRAIKAQLLAMGLGESAGTPEVPAAAMRALIADPLTLDASVRRVLVSPVSALGYVPFTLLFPGREIAYVPSGTTLRLLRERKTLPSAGILSLGDPVYTRASQLLPLPASRREAEAIGTTCLLGAEATEAGLRAAVAKGAPWRAVHLACHGLVNGEKPLISSLALTPSGDDDGYLHCAEILRMQVPADLVVLSACETAKGKIYGTEGIVGFTRSFMHAGAPRVLCSLWKVDDKATQALMLKFYELWQPKDGSPGLPAAAALRKAQAHIQAQSSWQHPYYWAAWVLWGLPE